VFQIKDLTANVLPGRGLLLGPNCRISATDPALPECATRSAGPRPKRSPRAPNPPHPVVPDPLCAASRQLSAVCGEEHGHGPRGAAGLDDLRRELRAALDPR
jgi:hypothetical protein